MPGGVHGEIGGGERDCAEPTGRIRKYKCDGEENGKGDVRTAGTGTEERDRGRPEEGPQRFTGEKWCEPRG